MKKHSLVKVISLLLLVVVLLTYFIAGREGSVSYLALLDIVINFSESFYYFFDTFVFILVVGGFYGILNKTKVYRKLVDLIVNKFKDNRKLFVIAVTIIFALVSSLTGMNLALFIFIPLFVSVILLMGYDKLVAMSATVGAILVGFIGGIFTTVKTASGTVTFDKLVGLDGNFTNVIPRILLLVISTGLLIFNIICYIKKLENGEGEDISSNDLLLMETKDKTGKAVKMDYSDVNVWPLIVVYSLLFVLFVLGFIPWDGLFGVSVFTKFHTWLTGLAIGKYNVFTSLISANIPAFGEWTSLGNFIVAILVVGIFALIMKFIGKIKFDSAFDAFILGAKKLLPAAVISVFAYTVLICSYNNGFIETIITNATEKFGDNVIAGSLISFLGSILNVDLYYTNAGVFSVIVSSLSDAAKLDVYSIAFQSIFGLVSLIGPTSLLLIVTLTYLDIPYTKWLKYIWRFVLELVIAIFVVMMIVSLI